MAHRQDAGLCARLPRHGRDRHRATVDDMRRVGRYVERQVLAQAVTWHVEERVVVEGDRTIVFA